jgi:hypothetical protein
MKKQLETPNTPKTEFLHVPCPIFSVVFGTSDDEPSIPSTNDRFPVS